MMNIPFQLQGDNFAVNSTADSSLFEFQINQALVPNALLVSVPVSTSNTVVAVNASFDEFNSDAVVPADGAPGRGIVVIPGAPVLFTLNTRAAASGNLYVSVASTANVTVYLSGVVI
jgi:hypothetical protein